ncbi:MAG: RNA polymerase sigma factor [Gammaproteobacteria bacterium]|nr:RNA polymerase sigma factor [Gammaproteobacteria bacterium]
MNATWSIEKILAEYGHAMSRVAASYEANPALREEVLQDIALAVWQSLPRLQEPGKAKAFVLRIAHNKSVDHVARQVRQVKSSAQADETAAKTNPETELSEDQGQTRLLMAVRRLPIRHRQVVSLLLEGMSYKEIAEILDISASNVGARVNRAKTQLKEILKHE